MSEITMTTKMGGRRGRMTRLARRAAMFLLAGLVATVGVAWGCAAFVDVLAGGVSPTGVSVGNRYATISVWRRPGAELVALEWEPGPRWSPGQATGAPNTPMLGDVTTAWAPASTSGSPEWLVLEYPHAVVPQRIEVYETYNPGAIRRITAFDAAGAEKEIWAGTDPSRNAIPGASGVAVKPTVFPVTGGFPTQKIKIYQGSPEVLGWNEIDAVGMVDAGGVVTWASGATASSWYGSASYVTTLGTEDVLPTWAEPFAKPTTATPGAGGNLSRVVDGRGWPFIALSCDRQATALLMPPSSMSPYVSSLSSYSVASSLSGGMGSTSGGTTLGFALPWRPAWAGLLADVVLYAMALAILHWTATAPLRFVLEVGRMRRGHCLHCGYDLQFDFPRGCPECGWRRGTQDQQTH